MNKECVVCYDETEIQYWDCGTCKNGFLCVKCMKSYNKKLCPLCKTVEGLCYCVNQDKLIIEFKNIVSKIKPHKIKTDNLFWLENSNYVIDSIDFWDDYSYQNIILDFVDKEHRIKFERILVLVEIGVPFEGMNELNNIDKIMATMFKDFGGVVYAYSYTKMCNALKAFDHRYQEKFDWIQQSDESDPLEIWNLSDIFLKITGSPPHWKNKNKGYMIHFESTGEVFERFREYMDNEGIIHIPAGVIAECLENEYEDTGFTESIIGAIQVNAMVSDAIEILMKITDLTDLFTYMRRNESEFHQYVGLEEDWGIIMNDWGDTFVSIQYLDP